MKKLILAIALSIVLFLGIMPNAAFAGNIGTITGPSQIVPLLRFDANGDRYWLMPDRSWHYDDEGMYDGYVNGSRTAMQVIFCPADWDLVFEISPGPVPPKGKLWSACM